MSVTFYHQQVLKIKNNLYPGDELCKQVIEGKKFIDNNFTENISLDNIAGKAFYSKFHFLRLFKLLYGVTPHQYLTSLRIKKAKQLLRENISTPGICITVGFNSISSFKALFKKHTSFTPSSYKKQFSRQS